jgi:hypothetical protein
MQSMSRTLALLVLLGSTNVLAADIGISPPRHELVAAAGENVITTVTVLTTADGEQHVYGNLGDLNLDITGNAIYFAPGSTTHSAAAWITLDVNDFVLSPRQARDVRLSVAIPPDALGTHHAMVFFTVVPPPTEIRGVGVITTARVGLTVYVTVAGTERAGSELVDLYQADDRTITAVILNTGNTVMRLGGEIQLRDEAGEVRHTLEVPDVPVLRESERELTFDLPDDIEPGFYVALALIQDSRGGVLAGELPFEVP